MTDKDEALRLALEALELMYACYAHPDWVSHKQQEEKILAQCVATTMTLRQAIKAALEAKNEKPCPEFWDWLPKAYRHGDVGDEPRFTKYNMEVAFLAGKQSAALEAKDEPVAWVCDGEVRSLWWDKNQALDRNAGHEFTPLYATPPQRKPLTDEEIQQIFIANSVVVDNGNAYMVAGLRTVNIARDIEAAHGIKGEA